MKTVYPESSIVESFLFSEKNETLEIKFKNGNEYLYRGVPKHTYDELLEAPSKGAYISREIKTKYEFEKLSD